MKKVMVFGTFDLLHPGHLDFFRQAKRNYNYLIVVVARDYYVQKAKGVKPKNDEKKRVSTVRKSSVVNKAILGSKTHNFYRTVRTYKPQKIALGYDQKPTIPKLKKDLRKHRLSNIEIIRLKPHNPKRYKSSKLLNDDGI